MKICIKYRSFSFTLTNVHHKVTWSPNGFLQKENRENTNLNGIYDVKWENALIIT